MSGREKSFTPKEMEMAANCDACNHDSVNPSASCTAHLEIRSSGGVASHRTQEQISGGATA